MATFIEATRIKNSLKIRLSQKSWFKSISIEYKENDGFCLVVYTGVINDIVKKFVPHYIDNVDILLDLKK
jgi:hypothetical protein